MKSNTRIMTLITALLIAAPLASLADGATIAGAASSSPAYCAAWANYSYRIANVPTPLPDASAGQLNSTALSVNSNIAVLRDVAAAKPPAAVASAIGATISAELTLQHDYAAQAAATALVAQHPNNRVDQRLMIAAGFTSLAAYNRVNASLRALEIDSQSVCAITTTTYIGTEPIVTVPVIRPSSPVTTPSYIGSPTAGYCSVGWTVDGTMCTRVVPSANTAAKCSTDKGTWRGGECYIFAAQRSTPPSS